MCTCRTVTRWFALITHTRTSAFAGMPPRRNARSPPRVQPQHDQDEDIRVIRDGLNELENDQAEEIRLIRDGLNALEQKHTELLKKHDDLVEWCNGPGDVVGTALTYALLAYLPLAVPEHVQRGEHFVAPALMLALLRVIWFVCTNITKWGNMIDDRISRFLHCWEHNKPRVLMNFLLALLGFWALSRVYVSTGLPACVFVGFCLWFFLLGACMCA